MPTSFKGQKYSSIRSEHLKKGTLFEDPEFPANNKSIYFSKIDNEIEWKRPKELCKVPRLVVEGVSCDDLHQGELGNCWFVTACASLTLEKKLFDRVVPDVKEQDWQERAEKNTYAGVFHFQFWRFGEWIDVVVDDRLPTKNGKLIFCHSNTRNEFWSALLEKAYAKLYGDYESLITGRTGDALVDFTSGVAENLVLSKINIRDENIQTAFFHKLKDATENRALVNCNIDCAITEVGKETPQGLVLGHGYNITRVVQINVDKKLQGAVGAAKLYMIRMANPWGVKEWNGAWSDGSSEWTKINKTEWEKLGLKFEQEGEFWMNLDDFINNFTTVDICHFVNTAIISVKKSWNESVLHSEWSVSGRNGGSDFRSPTFLSNPQYMFDVAGINDNIMVSLEQHDIKPGRQAFGQNLNYIGFQIMKVEENRKYRVHLNEDMKDLIYKSEYLKTRSVFGVLKVKKGRYVIIPTTREPGELGPFMLRLYTGNKASGKELTEEGPSKGCPCFASASLATQIIVLSGEELELLPGSKVKTFVKYSSLEMDKPSYFGFPLPNFNIHMTGVSTEPGGAYSSGAPGLTSITEVNVFTQFCHRYVLRIYSYGIPLIALDPYVVIKCEGEKVQSETASNTKTPEYDLRATFYRKKPNNPITIEVWNDNVLIDDFLGEARVMEDGTEEGLEKTLELYGRKKEAEVIKPGKLKLKIRSSHDLQYL